MSVAHDVRERLLQAAFQRFTRQGYHGTSMRQIARDAAVSLGNIYNYFPNKETLFAAVLEAYHPYHELLPLLEQALATDDTTDVERLALTFARKVDDSLQRRPELLRLLLIEVVEFQSRHVAPLYRRELLPRLRTLLARWGHRFLSPYPPEVVLRAFLGMMFAHHLLQHAVYPQAVGRLEDFVHIYLYGILGGQPSGEVSS